MDENTLTGEAIPVPKFEIENNERQFEYGKFEMNILYEGSILLDFREKQGNVKALVIRTGFSSFKVKKKKFFFWFFLQ